MRPLAVIGNVNVDLILGPAAPGRRPGTEIIVDHDELRVGGAAGNSAPRLGMASASSSRSPANVGNDQFGRWLKRGLRRTRRRELARCGPSKPRSLSASRIPTASAPSSRPAVTVPRFSLADVRRRFSTASKMLGRLSLLLRLASSTKTGHGDYPVFSSTGLIGTGSRWHSIDRLAPRLGWDDEHGGHATAAP